MRCLHARTHYRSQWRREMLETAYMRVRRRRNPCGARPSIPPDATGRDDARAESTLAACLRRSTQLLASDFPARARSFRMIDPTPRRPVRRSVDAGGRRNTTSRSASRGDVRRRHRDEALRFLELFLWRARLPTDGPRWRAILRLVDNAGGVSRTRSTRSSIPADRCPRLLHRDAHRRGQAIFSRRTTNRRALLVRDGGAARIPRRAARCPAVQRQRHETLTSAFNDTMRGLQGQAG